MWDMQPLEYKEIGGEEHLTFDCIRRLVLNQLSELSEREAKKHIEKCTRCQGIHTSLVKPDEIRQSNSQNVLIGPMVLGLGLVVVLIGVAASILYFGGKSKPTEEKIADFSSSQETDIPETPEVEGNREPIVEINDTLNLINEKPAEESGLQTNKQFDRYIENGQSQPRVRLRGIYGEITADGSPLSGVTVKVPGSGSGRVTDEDGKYYIQVPIDTKSLLFIYQGKQLTKDLDPNHRRLDIRLKSESLTYPDSRETEKPTNVES